MKQGLQGDTWEDSLFCWIGISRRVTRQQQQQRQQQPIYALCSPMCIISTSAINTSPKSEEKNPCFLLFPNSGWKVWVWRPTVAPSQVFISFLHPPRYPRTGLLDSCFVLDSFFSTLDFFSTLVGRCVYGAHRGPCTVSTDGEGQRGQLA